MLGIKDDTGRWKVWHVNEGIPKLEGRVITFQADGHELEMILLAMQSGFTYRGHLIPACPKCGSVKISCREGCTWEVG